MRTKERRYVDDTSKVSRRIPAETRRAVLVESGHKCAIPKCGHGDVDIHHIVPWEICRKHEYRNLIALCPNCHRRAHKGEIDRKSLLIYKAQLEAAFRISEECFSAPAVEIKRRLYEVNPVDSECAFKFDFPDFLDPMTRIVSKNIEAWGQELLVSFRQSQDVQRKGHSTEPDYPMAWLNGSYEVIRQDEKVVSVRYDIEKMAFSAAHRSHETRVQNYLVSPFLPLTLDELLVSFDAIKLLSQVLRSRLLASNSDLDFTHVELGIAPGAEGLSRFVINHNGFTFIFDEYEIASYAQGRSNVHLDFEELRNIFKNDVLDLLMD
jgi:hypothetical protein